MEVDGCIEIGITI